MVYIPLRIEKQRMSREDSNFLLFAFAIFTIGILFGAVLSGYGTFPTRPTAKDNVAAVLISTSPAPVLVEENLQASALTAPEVTPDEETATAVTEDELFLEDAATIDEFFASTLTQVRSEVELNTARTFALGTEIERLKNESVSLIAAFEQNCGSWADTCAVPYKDALDKNNTSYNRLAGELELLISELDRARESERIILASQ